MPFVIRVLRVIWASPDTLVGLSIACLGLCFGGRARIQSHAIEFYDGGIKALMHSLPITRPAFSTS